MTCRTTLVALFLAIALASGSASAAGGPVNDVCGGAIAVPSCGNPSPSVLAPAFPVLTTTVNQAGATSDEDPAPSCKSKKAAFGVWYSFMPHASGTYRISTCADRAPGTTVEDTAIALFRSQQSCPQGAEIACNDDDSGCAGHERQSTVTIELDAFKSYYILAYGSEDEPPGAIQVSIDRVQKGILADGGFEQGTFGEDWFTNGDVSVLGTDPLPACFTEDTSERGCYMACMSNADFFGGTAVGGLRSDLTSREVVFDARPTTITVSFTVDFQTEETPAILGTNDAFEARLITLAGSFPIIQIDAFGRTPPGGPLKVSGFTGLVRSPDGCTLVEGIGTRRLTVTWTKSINAALRGEIGRGPVNVEFSIVGQGTTEGRSIACVDDVRVIGSTN